MKPRRREPLSHGHNVASQKMKILNNSAAQVSNLASLKCFQASKMKHFSSLHHWLLLPICADTSASSDEPLITALEPMDLPLNSHVTVARPGLEHILLQNVYRLATGQPLTVTSPRPWSRGQVWPPEPRRDNYGGTVIKTVVIVSTSTQVLVAEVGQPAVSRYQQSSSTCLRKT